MTGWVKTATLSNLQMTVGSLSNSTSKSPVSESFLYKYNCL